MEMRTVAAGIMLAGLVLGSSACSAKTSGHPVVVDTAAYGKTIDLNASKKPYVLQVAEAMTCADKHDDVACAKSIKDITFTAQGTVPFVMSAAGLDFVTLAVSRTGSTDDGLPAFCPKTITTCDDIKTGDKVSIAVKIEVEFSTHGQLPEIDQLKQPAFVVQSISKQ